MSAKFQLSIFYDQLWFYLPVIDMIAVMFGIFSKSKKSSSKKKKNSAKAKKSSGVKKAERVTAPPVAPLEEQPSSPTSIASAQEKLTQAKARLESGEFKRKLGPSDRQALIQQAMAVHKVQSKLIDDLGDETKQRLRSLAMEKVFKIKTDD